MWNQFRLHKKLVLAALALLIVYLTWSWTSNLRQRLQPLDDYLVYDKQNHFPTLFGPTHWRKPVSRMELLLAAEHEVQYPPKPTPKPDKQEPAITQPEYKLPVLKRLKSDDLEDFVIDRQDSYGYPESSEELAAAIKENKALRASLYFSFQYLHGAKPFYGEIPTSLCYSNNAGGIGVHKFDRYRFWQDPRLVNAYMNIPEAKKPEVFLIAANSGFNLQLAGMERKPPVAYQSEQYWAVLYAGRNRGFPKKIVIDRVTVGKEQAEISLFHPQLLISGDYTPCWIFVPLGRLPDGPYTVNVRNVNDDEITMSVTENLRQATEEENAARRMEMKELPLRGTEESKPQAPRQE